MNAQSTSIIAAPVPLVYAAMAAVMSDIGSSGISKSRKNQQQGYSFRGIDEVYNALSPILAKHRLLILPRVMSRHQDERTTKSGSPLFYTVVDVEFDLVCADDGSRHTIRTVGEAMDSADKSSNKAMSAAFKYAAMQAFCIPTEGDGDADATTHDIAPRDRKPPATGEIISKVQMAQIHAALDATGRDAARMCAHYKIDALPDLPAARFTEALDLASRPIKRAA